MRDEVETIAIAGEQVDVASSKDEMEVLKTAPSITSLNMFYASGQGNLIIDPVEAEAEYGKELASQLKLDATGTIILWPQPDDNTDDPQNWSSRKKLLFLVILTMAAFVPDFTGSIQIAAVFDLAREFNTTPGEVNNVSFNWSLFLIGPGGIASAILVKRYGRLPVLFWSQLIGLVFCVGCAVATSLPSFAAMRCLNAFFSTAPQVMGLYVINDLYPFHLQARMLSFWTCGFISSPYLSPWLFGYLVAKISYRWAYWITCVYVGIVVILIAVFMEETLYHRLDSVEHVRPIGLRARIKSLIGITGFRQADNNASWREATWPMIRLLGAPHLLAILIYTGWVFGLSIGMNVTNVIFIQSPPPLGYGLSTMVSPSLYATPVVAVFLGEFIGRFLNDFVAIRLARRNKGVFQPEMRLWTLYLSLPSFIAGSVLLGAALQYKFNLGALVIGWGLAEIAVMMTIVATLNYANNAFAFPGEISALLNLARVLGGFTIPYFQVNWVTSRGAIEVFGYEAAIVAGLFILIVPVLQWKGPQLRARFSPLPAVKV